MNGPHELPLAIDADHPAFAGHFPDFPVVPGAVLMDEALHAIAAVHGTSRRIAWAKFLRPVRPGDRLRLTYTVAPDGTIRFEIVANAQTAAAGSLPPPAAN
jgi:3-hydroxymyristoyl/3-hydroxydecanoyl-(acyl carrier protein) dehydratase